MSDGGILKNGTPQIGDADGNQIEELKNFHIENISVEHKADLISAPIELGEKRFDNKVLQPMQVNVTGYVQAEDYDKMLEKLFLMWANREYEFYSVQTRSGDTYTNLCLENLPEKETPEKYDLVYCTLNFKEMIITQKMQRVTASASDSNTKSGGQRGAK